MAAKKVAWDIEKARGEPPLRALVYHCAFCGHRGGTLKQYSKFLVCADEAGCGQRQDALPTSRREDLAVRRLAALREGKSIGGKP